MTPRLLLALALASACKDPPPPPPPQPPPRPTIVDAGMPSLERAAPKGGEVKKLPGGVLELRGHTEAILAVAFDPQGRRAATGSLDRSIRVWDLEEGKLLWSAGPADEAITAIAFDPSGDVLAVGDRGFQVRLFAAQDGALIARLPHPDAVNSLSFSPDGGWLAVAGLTGNGEVYPVTGDGKSPCELRGRTVDFTDDGKVLVSATQAGALIATTFPACKKQKETSTAPHQPLSDASAKATLVATHNPSEPQVLLWDAIGGRMLGKLDKQTGGVTSAVLSSDGTRALVASDDRHVRLYDVAKLEVLKSIETSGLPFATLSADTTKALIADNIVARVVPLKP